MRYLIAVAVFTAGFFMVFKTQFFMNYFGRISFFERKMGRGYSHEGWKIIGLLLMLVSLMIVTKQFDKIVLAVARIFRLG